MDKRKKYIAVLDTETVSPAKDLTLKLVYDIGITIIDKKGHIYGQANWLVSEIYNNRQKWGYEPFGDKLLTTYVNMVQTGKIQPMEWTSIKNQMNDFLDKYNVSVISAYNVNFDTSALRMTNLYFGSKTKILYRPFEVWDIWTMSVETILQQKAFKKMAEYFNWKTIKGNIKTSAEVAYKYMTLNNNFYESHTALDDTEIECQILTQCLRQHKKMDKRQIANPWRLCQGA